jgi:hypothetical protein
MEFVTAGDEEREKSEVDTESAVMKTEDRTSMGILICRQLDELTTLFQLTTEGF